MENLKNLFNGLEFSEADLGFICSKFRFKEYAKNEYLLMAGQIANKLFFIEEGSVILGNETEDQFITRHVAKEKEFITSLESFSKQNSTTEFLKATEQSQVYFILKKDFDAVLKSYPPLEKFYEQFIFDTLIKCQQRIRDLISLDAKAYYKDIMQKNPDYLQRIPQYDLASYMGIEPQSLSRLRKAKN